MDDSYPAAVVAAPSTTSHSLDILTEYAHTLDTLPIDISRVFADLRELDAVLTANVSSVTNKIYHLIDLIEDRSIPNEQRLIALNDVAEEAHRVRPGADDKVRMATQGADILNTSIGHLTTIATHLTEFEPAMLVPKTRYPHVSTKSFVPPHAYETGRRRRAPTGGAWLGAAELSPQKKRKPIAEEDMEYGRSPRKDKTGEGQARPRARTKKVERHPSPPESVHSSTSMLPAAGGAHRNGGTNRNGQGAASSSKRRSNNTHAAAADGLPIESGGTRRDNLVPSSSTAHPSLQEPSESKRDKDRWSVENGVTPGKSRAAEKANTAAALEGSPVAVGADVTPLTATGEFEAEIENEIDDGRVYCTCNNTGGGEMIGCDGKNCEIEWFHMMCVGLTKAPDKEWYCEACLVKQSKKQGSRNAKKRVAGRTNGRGA